MIRHMLSRGTLFFVFYLFFLQILSAQESKLLILDKIGSRYRITYSIGDEIRLKLIGENFEIRDEITDITDSLIRLSSYWIPLGSIEYVKTRHTRGLLSPSNGPKLIIAGLALFTFDLLNQTLVQGDSYEADRGVIIASASLIGVGGLLMAFKYRKFKPGNRKRIRTLVIY